MPWHMLECNLYKSVLSFQHVGSGDPTKVVRLGISLSTESSSQPLCDFLKNSSIAKFFSVNSRDDSIMSQWPKVGHHSSSAIW